MMTSLTNGFSLSSAGAHDEAKGQRGGSKWQSSVCRLLALGRCEKTLARTCTVQAGGGGGRRVPPKDRESFALISPAAFCSVYVQKEKKKKEKEKKKFSFIWWGTHVNATFRRYPCRFCLFFSRLRPRVAVARVTHKCVLVPVCFLGYFTKLVGTVVSSKKKKKEREGRWLISCIWGNIKPYISRIHRGRRQDRKWAKPSEITWEKVRRIGFKWACIQGFPRSNAVPWGSKEEYEGRV